MTGVAAVAGALLTLVTTFDVFRFGGLTVTVRQLGCTPLIKPFGGVFHTEVGCEELVDDDFKRRIDNNC